jgi:hypothetical protein
LIARAFGDAGWSSPVARQAHNLKVVGSNPAPATNLNNYVSLENMMARFALGFIACGIPVALPIAKASNLSFFQSLPQRPTILAMMVTDHRAAHR